MQYRKIVAAATAGVLLVWLPVAVAQRPSGDCGYYVNRDGKTVPRPCGDARTQPPPSDATATCRDGTYSYSLHRSGTCSGHGGVQRWR
jgi:hypothetical protein